MVQFEKPLPGALIMVWCKAWANNIYHNRNDLAGSVHFELLYDNYSSSWSSLIQVLLCPSIVYLKFNIFNLCLASRRILFFCTIWPVQAKTNCFVSFLVQNVCKFRVIFGLLMIAHIYDCGMWFFFNGNCGRVTGYFCSL